MSDDAPRVSVVVPTFRRPDLLARCLAGLAEQDVGPDTYEVIVADDEPSDATRRSSVRTCCAASHDASPAAVMSYVLRARLNSAVLPARPVSA